jgi:hypothetical protein
LRVCAGETEEQYLATEALVRQIGFDRVNTAAYSPRPNTPAAEWDNQVRHNREQGGWIDGPACGCGGCVWEGGGVYGGCVRRRRSRVIKKPPATVWCTFLTVDDSVSHVACVDV